MCGYIKFLPVLVVFLLVGGCTTRPDTTTQVGSTPSPPLTQIQLTSLTSESRSTLKSSIAETPTLIPSLDHDCASLEPLTPDSTEAQQIVEEFVSNYQEQYPTEYMGMAILERVYSLGEWAIVTGSITGEGTDIIAVHKTPQGYQIAEFIHLTPLESDEELEARAIQPLLEKLPEAPQALITCMDQSWLLPIGYPSAPANVFQLAYVSTDDFTTQGVTEIKTVQSDGSNPDVLLHESMLIMGLDASPDGGRIVFWGCPGSLSSDCSDGEDLDIWVVNWDGSNLRNLTEDSAANESHPDWSADSRQLVFDSDRSGNPQLYIMNSDGYNLRQITDGPEFSSEPNWSPDGNWIAYHCRQASETGIETRICVVSPDGQPAGEPISGTTPVWSPARLEGDMQLAFLCFQAGQSDICTARPDGSGIVNLTNTAADEHSAAWSPDGKWLAFVSNRGNDIDIYKVCVACPGEPIAVRLTDEPRPAGWPAWSPDGSQIAYESAGDLLVIHADLSSLTYLTSGVFSPPIWRP